MKEKKINQDGIKYYLSLQGTLFKLFLDEKLEYFNITENKWIEISKNHSPIMTIILLGLKEISRIDKLLYNIID